MTALESVVLNGGRGRRFFDVPVTPFVRLATNALTPTRISSDSPASVTEAVLPGVAAGESGAAERCFERYGGLVWSLARKYFAIRSDAEDAVQEAFLSLWENAARFDASVASETTFVAMIARRRMIDLVRRAGVRRRGFESQSSGGADSMSAVEEAAAAEPTAVQADGVTLQGFEIGEEAERVRVHMRQLSEDQQRVLNLALVEGRSQSQIAEQTGWPLGTVKSHARRGMKKLRELLDNKSQVPTSTQEARQ